MVDQITEVEIRELENIGVRLVKKLVNAVIDTLIERGLIRGIIRDD